MGRLEHFVRDGLTFEVRDCGPLDGDAVVLLHGWPDDSGCWSRIVPALNAAGYRTLAPDQRGYSPGARPRGRAAYRVEEAVRDVLALVEEVGRHKAHVVGHDWGAVVGWTLAGRHPRRVETLTAVSVPHPAVFARAALTSSQAFRSWYLAFFQLPWLPERLLEGRIGPMLAGSGVPGEDARRLGARMTGREAIAGGLNWYRALPLSLADPVPPSQVPTTFVWGRRDPAIGRYAAERAGEGAAAGFRFVELGGGHWLPYTHPLELSSVLLGRVRAVAPA